MLNPFLYIRRKVAEAFVLGGGDGLKALFPDEEHPPADLTELRALLATATQTRALPAADEGEPAKKGKVTRG